jgi:hypothetical protein
VGVAFATPFFSPHGFTASPAAFAIAVCLSSRVKTVLHPARDAAATWKRSALRQPMVSVWAAPSFSASRKTSVQSVVRHPRYGDRHDVRYAEQERSTCNVQLSTFNAVTERAHGGRDMGTDTEFGRPNSWPGGPDQAPVGRWRQARRADMGTDTVFDIPIRNVQRETFNSQLLTG